MDNCESITRWRTIQRPSASAAKPTVRDSSEDSVLPRPWTKQSLACLEHIKTLDKFHESSDDTTIELDAERIHYEMLVSRPVSFSLTPTDLATEISQLQTETAHRSREES
jgi:hypothetical protein